MEYDTPGYLRLYSSGELARRVRMSVPLLRDCRICPRDCGVNRYEAANGYCRSGAGLLIASICDHQGEEPVISGTKGSGTVFLGHCNLKCVFCQNHQISQPRGKGNMQLFSPRQLAERLVQLQDGPGVHNINFVSPGHYVPQIIQTIYEAAGLGLHIPVVYNSNGYDSLEILRLLDGIVDIYLPDFKYSDDSEALACSGAPRYTFHAKQALKEMYRQVGHLVIDKNGLARRGLIVRHLILPNDLAGSEQVLRWIARELSPGVTISLMAQYYPGYRAHNHPLLSRKISWSEYNRVVSLMERLGFSDGFIQEMEAPEYYLPDFNRVAHPFEEREKAE